MKSEQIKDIEAQSKKIIKLAKFIELHRTEGNQFSSIVSHELDDILNKLAEVEYEMKEAEEWWQSHDEVSKILGRKPGEFIK